MTKKTKCEHKGRHEYRILLDTEERRLSLCHCGKRLIELKND